MARCDLDLAMAAFGLFPGPYPVGHEAVAEVVTTGDDMTRWQAGDRVLVPFQVSCGQCAACRGSRFAACHRYRASWHEGPWPVRFGRAPITVDNTGDPDGLACTLRSTDDYGTCTSVAIQFAPTTPVPLLAAMYTKGVTFHASRADSRRLLPEVADLVAGGLVDPGAVPTTVVPWEQADRAWLEPVSWWRTVRSDPGGQEPAGLRCALR